MNVTLIRTNRKTVSLQMKAGGTILVRAPLWYKESDLEKLLKKHETWIQKTKERLKDRIVFPEDQETIKALKKQAKALIPLKVERYAEIMNLRPTAVRIGSARGRFGSCSAKGSLNFSCFLMLYPEEAIDYVVVHELAHLKCRGHDQRFYNLVAKYMPDYKDREKLLKK